MAGKRTCENDETLAPHLTIPARKSRRISEANAFASRFNRLGIQERDETSIKAPSCSPAMSTFYGSKATPPLPQPLVSPYNPASRTRPLSNKAHVLVGGVLVPRVRRREQQDAVLYTPQAHSPSGLAKRFQDPLHNSRPRRLEEMDIDRDSFAFKDAPRTKAKKGKSVAFNDTHTVFELPSCEPHEIPLPSLLQKGQTVTMSFMDEDWNVRHRNTFEVLAHRPHLAKKTDCSSRLEDDPSKVLEYPNLAPTATPGGLSRVDQRGKVRGPKSSHMLRSWSQATAGSQTVVKGANTIMHMEVDEL